MKRLILLILSVAAIAMAINTDLSTKPWPLNGNNEQRQGFYTGGTALTSARILWTNTWQVGAGIWGSGVSDSNYFYISVDPGSGSSDDLIAIDVATGANVWGADFADWANGTPALSIDTVFASDYAGNVYAVNKADGTILWSTNLNAGATSGGIMLNDGKLYLSADIKDASPGGLFCLSAETGAILWQNQSTNATMDWRGNGPTLNIAQDVVYYTTDRDIIAVDTATGSTLWMRTYAPSVKWRDEKCPIVDAAGNLYVGMAGLTNQEDNDVVISLTPAGALRWTYDFGMDYAWHGGGYAFSADGSTLYCTRRSGEGATGTGLTALNTADGTLKWELACGDSRAGCVVGAGGVIISVFDGGSGPVAKGIIDNGTSGEVAWSVQFAADTPTSFSWPTLLPNGNVIVENEGGVIACLTVAEPPAPQNVQATYGTYTNRVDVTWNSVVGVTAYGVYRNVSGSTNDPLTELTTTETTTAFSDMTAIPGTVYYYFVRAQNNIGWSPYSSGAQGLARDTSIPLGVVALVDGATGSGTALSPYDMGTFIQADTGTVTLSLSISDQPANTIILARTAGSVNFAAGSETLPSSIAAGSSNNFTINYSANGAIRVPERATFTVAADSMPTITFHLQSTTIPTIPSLRHRYSFNSPESDDGAYDSIGNATGTYMNSLLVENGSAWFPGTNNNNSATTPFVNLPLKTVQDYDALTVEFWCTPQTPNSDLSVMSWLENGQSMALAPGNGALSRNRFFINNYLDFSIPTPPIDQERQFVVTIQGKDLRIYQNGVLSTNVLTDTTFNWGPSGTRAFIGQCPNWEHETLFHGGLNEYRLYEEARSIADVQESYLYGPDNMKGDTLEGTATLTPYYGISGGSGTPADPFVMTSESPELTVRVTGVDATQMTILEQADAAGLFSIADFPSNLDDRASADFTVNYSGALDDPNDATYIIGSPGQLTPITFTISTVPEPAFLLVLAGGLLALWRLRK